MLSTLIYKITLTFYYVTSVVEVVVFGLVVSEFVVLHNKDKAYYQMEFVFYNYYNV